MTADWLAALSDELADVRNAPDPMPLDTGPADRADDPDGGGSA